jgi:cell division septal protein FtsQ
VTRILREYRRERAAHSMTAMCGALAFMAAVTLWVQDRDEHGKVVQHFKTEGRAFAAWQKAAGQW